MAKRFTDTDLFDREWFQDLNMKEKLFWNYVCSKCDHAGVWNVNMRLASFYIGESLSKDEVLKSFGDKIIEIDDDKWWLKGFVSFQYGDILNESSRVHYSVLKILEKYNLVEGGAIIKTKPKKKQERQTKVVGSKRFKPPTIEEIQIYCDEQEYKFVDAKSFWNYYESNGWKVGKNKMKKWHSSVAQWNSRGAKTKNSKIYIQEGHGERKHKF